MKKTVPWPAAVVFVLLAAPRLAADGEPAYFPGPGDDWERKLPAEVGLDPVRITEAVRYAVEHETSNPTDLLGFLERRFHGLPDQEIVGPMKDRGGPAGVILRHGYVVAEWGDPGRVDMTFSVTKSYLATLMGLALDRGLLTDLDERVALKVDDGGFDSEHNGAITWRHLFQQTSEWEGTLFGKPDTADRRRGRERQLQAPGTFWEYNDVRVNRASLALLRIWGKALPEVLAAEVMEPVGASPTWQWHGYSTSDVVEGGRTVKSVSGGGHWGGGLWISTLDHARFGYLHLRRGLWGERRIFSEEWIERLTTPCELRPTYGLMWWLNTDKKLWKSAPATSYAARGGGDNVVWIDPEHDLVAVVRWIERGAMDGFLALVLAAAEETSYVDVTATHLPPSAAGPTMDARPGDVDGDGDLDLLLAQEHRPNLLLINDGSGRFTDASAERLPQEPHDSEDVVLADFDGDGDLDAVVVTEDDETNEVYTNDGRGFFTPGEPLPVTGRSNAVVSADLDGDGALDLVIGNNGQNVLLLGDGHGRFTDATEGRLPALADVTQDVELGDVDGDGDLDLLVGNEDRNRLLLNDGGGRFTDVSQERLPSRATPEETREADFGDVDGDGDLDVVFANIRGFVRDAEPRNRLLMNDGKGFYTDSTETRLPVDSDRSFDGDLVDVDGDGDLDLVTSNAERRGREVLETPWRVYTNDGGGAFREATAGLFPESARGRGFDVEVGDFNGDGVLDLYLASRGSSDRLLLGQKRPRRREPGRAGR